MRLAKKKKESDGCSIWPKSFVRQKINYYSVVVLSFLCSKLSSSDRQGNHEQGKIVFW